MSPLPPLARTLAPPPLHHVLCPASGAGGECQGVVAGPSGVQWVQELAFVRLVTSDCWLEEGRGW